jgi:hypothetical protein
MLVYQALKRLTGSVKVTHALDDHAFQEWRLDCDENGRDDENGKEDENPELPHATPTTIGTSILGPITWTDYEEDGHPAPENLRYEERVVSSHGVCWTNKAAYFRDHVTWLNHAPQPDTPQELAVAYLAVSIHLNLRSLDGSSTDGQCSTGISPDSASTTRPLSLSPTSGSQRNCDVMNRGGNHHQ